MVTAVRPVAEAESARPTFAQFLTEIMDARGLSAAQVATYTGASVNTVKAWLRGTQQPQPPSLDRLGERLGLPRPTLYAIAYDIEDPAEARMWYDERVRAWERRFEQMRRWFANENGEPQPS